MNATNSSCKMDTRENRSRVTRPFRQLRYPLPRRTSLTPDGVWTKPAVLASLGAGGWFGPASTGYRFDSPRTATFAEQAQIFFTELALACREGTLPC